MFCCRRRASTEPHKLSNVVLDGVKSLEICKPRPTIGRNPAAPRAVSIQDRPFIMHALPPACRRNRYMYLILALEPLG